MFDDAKENAAAGERDGAGNATHKGGEPCVDFTGNDSSPATVLPLSHWTTRYAFNHGFSLVPLHTMNGAKCACGDRECGAVGAKKNNPGKHPIVSLAPKGAHSASDDVLILNDWLKRVPRMNLGLAIPEGIVAFDVDPRNAGSTDSLPDNWQATLHAKTGGGGWHVLYRLPKGRKARSLGRGIDIKAAGGYIVVEPSMHASGRAYEWQDWSPLDDDEPTILDLPEAFLQPVQEPAPPSVATPAQANGWSAPEAFLRLSGGRQRLIAEGTPEGQRSEAFHGLVCGLADDGLSAHQIEAILMLHPAGIGHKYGGRVGVEIARCLDKRQPPASVSLGSVNPETGEIVPEDIEPLDLLELDATDPEPMDWVIDSWLARGHTTLLAANGGVGKSMLCLQLAVCVAAGLPFMGKPIKRGKVVIFSAEDDKRVIHRRLKNACRHLNVSMASLAGRLSIYDKTKSDPTLWRNGVTTDKMQEMADIVSRQKPHLTIIDNASDVYADNENDRAAVRAFMRCLNQVAGATETAMMLLAHVDKASVRHGEGVSTASTFSGSTAWNNSARNRWAMTKEDDAVVLRHEKNNHGPLQGEIKLEFCPAEKVWVPKGTSPAIAMVAKLTRNIHHDTILPMIARAADEGVNLSMLPRANNNAFKALEDTFGFPRISRSEFFRLLNGMLSNGVIEEQEYSVKGKTYKRLAITDAGRAALALIRDERERNSNARDGAEEA